MLSLMSDSEKDGFVTKFECLQPVNVWHISCMFGRLCIPFSEAFEQDAVKSPDDSLWKSIQDSHVFVADVHSSVIETVSEDELFWWNQLCEMWDSKPIGMENQ